MPVVPRITSPSQAEAVTPERLVTRELVV
ncbi:hypothetical protein E2C01_074056 [Portunus trituberculatus]|uniref:Uncharacterized protein n=1 Tax=Portunus trituberculatus TaxID=210409 RepID=A0A5B7IDB7_PORTR|nr:hypothetical protein [Portunus trituberculatus]